MRTTRESFIAILLITPLFFLALISCGESTNESITNENVIATIGSRNVTYDEIKDEGEDQKARNREIIALNRLIEQEVINQEFSERQIKPTNEEIEEKVKEINQEEWEGFGENDEDRIKILEMHRERMLLLIDALEIWQKNQEKGDEFAKNKLEPLGINQFSWESIKSQSNNPEFLEMLYFWKEIEGLNSSELKEVQLKYDRERLVSQAKERLKMERLRILVVPNYNELHEADRENEFRAWLRKRMAEKTVIYDDNYKLALEIY